MRRPIGPSLSCNCLRWFGVVDVRARTDACIIIMLRTTSTDQELLRNGEMAREGNGLTTCQV